MSDLLYFLVSEVILLCLIILAIAGEIVVLAIGGKILWHVLPVGLPKELCPTLNPHGSLLIGVIFFVFDLVTIWVITVTLMFLLAFLTVDTSKIDTRGTFLWVAYTIYKLFEFVFMVVGGWLASRTTRKFGLAHALFVGAVCSVMWYGYGVIMNYNDPDLVPKWVEYASYASTTAALIVGWRLDGEVQSKDSKPEPYADET
ncbi:MAG TPA: hypothetical protein VGQ41_27425 [Pyrinomonadaceae bacterium]|jgi:hypothetical protein|nr:hypothetical protein [Pyrinomonadaceae bacterium]